MKIDIHCHTRTTKIGENAKRNVTPEEFKMHVQNANVKMVAITNHNSFSKEIFIEFQRVVNKEFLLFPGIELDVKGISNDDNGHIIIICDDNELDEFTEKVNNLIKNKKPEEFYATLDEVIEFSNSIECLVLAHHMKPHSLSEESIKYIKSKIKNDYRFFYEPSSYRTLCILINNNYRALKGIDVTDWDNYENSEFPSLKLEVDSFKQFMYYLKKDEKVIKSLMDKENKTSVNISFDEDKTEKINLYDNVNIFFGGKGTGKTTSLDIIKKHFQNLGKKVSVYKSNDNIEKLDDKLKIKEKKLEDYDKDSKNDCFNYIKNWKEENVTQFKDYVDSIRYKGNSTNKSKMKLITINYTIENNETEVQEKLESLKKLKNIIKLFNVKGIFAKYLSEDSKLIEELNKVLKNIIQDILDSYYNIISKELTYFTIDKIKKIVEKNTNLKTKPNNTGFINFVNNRYNFKININSIIKGFNFEFIDKSIYVGNLGNNKSLYIKETCKMLSNDSKSIDGFENIRSSKEIKNLIYKMEEKAYDESLIITINDYKEKIDNNSISLNNFFGVKRVFIVNDKEYQPSSGEAAMIMLDESLKDDYDVYILDEPEKSFGNDYINDIILTKINNLSKMKKTIVISTHNANIAIRTFPYVSILKDYDNGIYKTYVGSPFTNKLININDETDVKNWKEESLKILEGGKEAFEEREDIYGK